MAHRRILVSVDEDSLRIVSKYAARRNMSVSGLIDAFLTGVAERERRALAARARMHAVSTTEMEPQKLD